MPTAWSLGFTLISVFGNCTEPVAAIALVAIAGSCRDAEPRVVVRPPAWLPSTPDSVLPVLRRSSPQFRAAGVHYWQGNWNYNFWSNLKPARLDADFRGIRELNFNTVIVSVPWGLFQLEAFPPRYSDESFQKLRNFLTKAAEHDLSVALRVATPEHLPAGIEGSNYEVPYLFVDDRELGAYCDLFRETARRLEVSGGQVGAQNAALSIMVGREKPLLDEVMPILQTMGKTITHCGPNGSGQIVKACNHIQVALNIAGMCEAFVLGAKAGVDPAVILQVLSGGYAQNRVMDVRGPKVIKGDFKPGFKSRFHFKDLNIILRTGEDFDVPLPVTGTGHKLFAELLNEGGGDLDHTGLITVLEQMAKHKAK